MEINVVENGCNKPGTNFFPISSVSFQKKSEENSWQSKFFTSLITVSISIGKSQERKFKGTAKIMSQGNDAGNGVTRQRQRTHLVSL